MSQGTTNQQPERNPNQGNPNEDLRKGDTQGRSTDPDGNERGLGDQDRNRERGEHEGDRNPDDLE